MPRGKNNYMKTINIIRKVLKFPFVLVTYPLIVIMGFFMTNFEDEWDVNYYKKMLTTWLW